MAYLLEVNEPRSRSEAEAHLLLSNILPNDWIVTTNLWEKNFQGNRKPEIDSMLITPVGVFSLDFKHLRDDDRVIPKFNGPWIGLDERRNPFDQGQLNSLAVKNGVFGAYDAQLGQKLFVEWLIVLTGHGVDWPD